MMGQFCAIIIRRFVFMPSICVRQSIIYCPYARMTHYLPCNFSVHVRHSPLRSPTRRE